MRKFHPIVFLLILLAAILAGCTDTGRLISTGLDARLTGIVCANDGTVTAKWHVTNTNIVPYLFSSVHSKVYVNGTYVGMIVNDNPLGIPPSSEVDRSGNITGGDAGARQVLAEALAQGSASCRVDSQIVIRIYDQSTEKTMLTHSGTVPVTAK